VRVMKEQKEKILAAICQETKVCLLYAFGSQKVNILKILKGEKVQINDPLTDIDIGVVFSFPLEQLERRYLLYAQLYNQLTDLFAPHSVDLVFLQENHSVFQGEAITGFCLYAQAEDIKDAYEEMILRRAADFKYVLDKYYQERLED